MFDHIGLAVHDLAQTCASHTAALSSLGLAIRYDKNDTIAFWPPDKWALRFYGRGDGPTLVHIALKAQTGNRVDAFYVAAIAAGGKDNVPPGPRPQYTPTYYAGFVLDPDGHNLEAVCYAVED